MSTRTRICRNGLKSLLMGFVNAQWLFWPLRQHVAALLPSCQPMGNQEAGVIFGGGHQRGLFMHSSYHNGENPKVVRMNAI